MTPITDTPGLPGYSADIVDTSSGGSLSADTGTAFVLGFTEKGPVTPTPVRSLAEYVAIFGDRVSYGYLYDTLDVAFREGLAQAYVQRVVGPSPVKGTIKLFDASGSTDPGDVSIIATAKNYETNELNLEVVNTAGSVVLIVTDDDEGTIETLGPFTTRAEIVAATSETFTFALGASTEVPRTASAASASGGTDDHSNATDTEWAAALAKLTKELGPGQVAMPGRTTDTAHLQLAAHAAAFNRVAVLDFDDTATVADLLADADAVTGTTGDRNSAGFGPWAIVPGITAGTTRTVPYSAIQLGLIARAEARTDGNSNVAAAGEKFGDGISRYATGLTQAAFSDADRARLNLAGYNVARLIDGKVVTYGYRSLADRVNDPEWVQFSGSREVCALAQEAGAVLRQFVFEQIDGKGHKLAELHGAIAGICKKHYDRGSLYGATAGDAYEVDTGPAVNPLAQLAEGIVKASIRARTSPTAEQVELEITHANSAEAL